MNTCEKDTERTKLLPKKPVHDGRLEIQKSWEKAEGKLGWNTLSQGKWVKKPLELETEWKHWRIMEETLRVVPAVMKTISNSWLLTMWTVEDQPIYVPFRGEAALVLLCGYEETISHQGFKCCAITVIVRKDFTDHVRTKTTQSN